MASGERVNAGFGNSALERRIAVIERVLSGLRRERIYSPRTDGITESFTVLASLDGSEESTESGGSCQFGSAYQEGEQWYLRGGALTCGPDNYDVPDQTFTAPAEGASFLAWVEVDFEANEEDGVLLPGILSSSAPQWDNGSAYPDNTVPTSADPTGKCIIPVGRVSTTSGVTSLASTGICNPVVIAHCPGSVSYSQA